MAKVNLYKLDGNLQELEKLLEDRGAGVVHEGQVRNWKIKAYIALDDNNTTSAVWWNDLFRPFINEDLFNRNYFGVVTIIAGEEKYCVSFGKSFFYLRSSCDPDFGIELAKRIANENDVRQKSSRVFGGSRSKELTNFVNESVLNLDEGESVEFLKAKTTDPDQFGQVASFGTSVKLTCELNLEKIVGLIEKVSRVLSTREKFKLPHIEKIHDPATIASLDGKLMQAVKDAPSVTEGNHFDILGVDFIFQNDEQITLTFRGNSSDTYDELTADVVKAFLDNQRISRVEDFNDLKVKVKTETQSSYSEAFRNRILYIDNETNYYLKSGRWYRFNEDYLKFLQESVNKIPVTQSDPIEVNTSLNEPDFLNIAESDHGYKKTHGENASTTSTTVEAYDLRKQEAGYVVKFGKAAKLGYAVDQAINYLNMLKAGKIKDDYKVKKIALWLFYDRVQTITQLSELKSIILLQKLVQFARLSRELALDYELVLGYRR